MKGRRRLRTFSRIKLLTCRTDSRQFSNVSLHSSNLHYFKRRWLPLVVRVMETLLYMPSAKSFTKHLNCSNCLLLCILRLRSSKSGHYEGAHYTIHIPACLKEVAIFTWTLHVSLDEQRRFLPYGKDSEKTTLTVFVKLRVLCRFN